MRLVPAAVYYARDSFNSEVTILVRSVLCDRRRRVGYTNAIVRVARRIVTGDLRCGGPTIDGDAIDVVRRYVFFDQGLAGIAVDANAIAEVVRYRVLLDPVVQALVDDSGA